MKEKWKDIENYEGLYQISNLGRVRRTDNGKERLLKPFLIKGYYVVRLSKKGIAKNKSMHRLIAKAFIPNEKKYNIVDHINGIKTDNRIENLEWVTAKENTIRAWKKGLCHQYYKGKFGKEHIKSKKILQIKDNKIINEYFGSYEAERKTGIWHSSINECCKNKRKTAGGFKWKYA